MSYEKQTWHNGDTITEQKLNHMEDGIANAGGGGGVFTIDVIIEDETPTLNQKAKDIYDAFCSGLCIVRETVDEEETLYPLAYVYKEGTYYSMGYYVSVSGAIQDNGFSAESPDDYPVRAEQ